MKIKEIGLKNVIISRRYGILLGAGRAGQAEGARFRGEEII